LTDLCGIELATPIINASGTFDALAARRAFGAELLERFPFSAFVSKTVTVAPRQGNPPPRLWELPGGMINSIGLPNKGLGGYLAEDLPALAALPVPLIVYVMGFSRIAVAELVGVFPEVDEGRVGDVRDVEENVELHAGLDEVVAEGRETPHAAAIAARAREIVGVRPGAGEIANPGGGQAGEAAAEAGDQQEGGFPGDVPELEELSPGRPTGGRPGQHRLEHLLAVRRWGVVDDQQTRQWLASSLLAG